MNCIRKIKYHRCVEVSESDHGICYNLLREHSAVFGNETHPLEDLYKESWYRDGIRDKEWVFDESTLDLISIYKIPSYSGIESYVAVRTDIPTLFESLNQLAVDQYGVHVQTQNDKYGIFPGKNVQIKMAYM